VSTLVRNELIKTEPHLASAASFLSVVSGGTLHNKGERKTDATVERPSGVAYVGSTDVAASVGAMTTEIIADVGAAVPSGPSPWEIKYAERQPVTRITASKSLLKDELKKKNPSSFSIAAFRKAAYGDESKAEINLETGDDATKDANCADVAASEVAITSEIQVDEPVQKLTVDVQPIGVEAEMRIGEEEAEMQQDVEILISEEEVMSTGHSEEEEDGSDGFSDRSISGEESARSQGSRKRRADKSPEREVTENERRGFPGSISSSEAGCRIHLPSTTGEMDVAPDATTPFTMVEADAAPGAPTPSMIEGAAAVVNVLSPSTTGELNVAPNHPVHSVTDESLPEIKDVRTDPTAVVRRKQALAPLRVELSSGIFGATEGAVAAGVERPLAVDLPHHRRPGTPLDHSQRVGGCRCTISYNWQRGMASYNYDGAYASAAVCRTINPGLIAPWAAYRPRRKRVCIIRSRLR